MSHRSMYWIRHPRGQEIVADGFAWQRVHVRRMKLDEALNGQHRGCPVTPAGISILSNPPLYHALTVSLDHLSGKSTRSTMTAIEHEPDHDSDSSAAVVAWSATRSRARVLSTHNSCKDSTSCRLENNLTASARRSENPHRPTSHSSRAAPWKLVVFSIFLSPFNLIILSFSDQDGC